MSLVLVIFIWLSFSPLLIATWINAFGPNDFIYVAKDLPVYIAVLIYFVVLIRTWNLKISSKLLYVLAFVLFLILRVIIDQAPDYSKFAAARQLCSPIILIMIGVLTPQRVLTKSVVSIGGWLFIFVISFGVYEVFSRIWIDGYLDGFFLGKGIGVINGYPAMMIEPIAGFDNYIPGYEGLPRMGATLLDPINLGHALVSMIILMQMYDKNIRSNIFKVALLLTFSKGAVLQYLIYIVSCLRAPSLKLGAIIVLVLMSVVISIHHPGVQLHIIGFVATFQDLSLFGKGLGSVGNYAVMTGGVEKTEIADSFLGAVIGQIGIVGFCLWSGAIYSLIRSSKCQELKILFFIQFSLSTLSENAFNIGSLYVLCIMLGLTARRYG